MPFDGFLAPSSKQAVLTRILRHSAFLHYSTDAGHGDTAPVSVNRTLLVAQWQATSINDDSSASRARKKTGSAENRGDGDPQNGAGKNLNRRVSEQLLQFLVQADDAGMVDQLVQHFRLLPGGTPDTGGVGHDDQ